MSSSYSPLQVIVELDNVGACTSKHWHRTITLSAPDWQAKIGRSSTNSNGGQQESATNALFSSRVVSREHAVIRADPLTRVITIEDVDSLHGTRVNGLRVPPSDPQTLYKGDTITLGTEVERIEQTSTTTFMPVKVQFFYSWSDEEYGPPAPLKAPLQIHSRNSFSTAYSDDEPVTPYMSDGEDGGADEEDDIYLKTPLQNVPRTFTVPSSSDISDDHISILSEDLNDEHDSPSSSPVGSLDLGHVSKNETRNSDAPEAVNNTLPGDNTREVIQIDSDDINSHDSSSSQGRQVPEEHDKPEAAPAPAAIDPPECEQSDEPEKQQQKPCDHDTTHEEQPPNVTPQSASVLVPTATKSSSFLQNILNNCNTESEDVAPRRSDSAWTTHNAAPYDLPVPVPLFYDGPSAQSIALPGLQRFSPVNVFRDVSDSFGVDNVEPSSNSYAGVEASEPSISSSVVPFAPAEAAFSHENQPSRKRKLEDVTDLASAKGEETQAKESATEVETTKALVVAEDAKQALPSVEVILERPTKQQKTEPVAESPRLQPSRKGSRFSTFAAGALAGVAIGSISTLIGLAALPADYFA